MGTRLKWALVLALTLAVACGATARASKPVVVHAGNIVLRLNGGVTPKALPRHRMAPISFIASAALGTADGSQPPATRTVTLDLDKQGTINPAGLATCRYGVLLARTTSSAKRACKHALIGVGKTTVRVALPETTPFKSSGRLLFFNGGTHHGTTTIYIHAYVHVPVATALVTVVKVRHIHAGPYGTRAVAEIPKIAGGAGSLTHFAFRLHRIYRRHGKRQSYLIARCGKGHLRAKASIVSASGRIGSSVTRPCRPRR